jgi:hypothetical protein
MATLTLSEEIFVTWIRVPPSEILILSMSLKGQLLLNLCCLVRLWVSVSFDFEASILIYRLIHNKQHQISRYLLIPLLSFLTMIHTDLQALQVILIIKKQVLMYF